MKKIASVAGTGRGALEAVKARTAPAPLRQWYLGVVCALIGGAVLMITHAPKAWSQGPQPLRQPNSMPVAQTVGRVQINSDLTVDLFGYYTVAEGFNFPLFNGTPSEKTATLTYRADRVGARAFVNGGLLQGLERPLAGNSTALSVYYIENPANRDWNDPETFNQGTLVARFQSRNAAVVVYPGSYVATSGITLERSIPFTANGQRYDVNNQANGLSLSLHGPAPALDALLAQIAKDGRIQIEQAGTAWNASSPN
ncbi:MAG: hypothetical protein U0Q16_28875 [Bryobacteraceae bacterium]